jgi:TP901 family phage tail tape measure protein
MPRIDALWWELGANTQELNRGLATATPRMARFATLMRLGPVAAVAALGAVAAVVAGKAVMAFASFDDKLTKSLAIMGDVSDSMREDMAAAAREVARETSFSADQAAESYFFLASAGFTAAESLQALPTVARFAQAGMFDMALATDLLTDAQSALGLKTGDLAQDMESLALVSDVLVKANTLANATVQQFSEALTNQAGPALKAARVDLEEGVAVLAAFADQGIKGAEAGTKLNILMRDLQTKALANRVAFEELNVTVFDSAGSFQNIADIIEDLEVALVDMNDEQRKATLLQLGFADRSVITIQAILGASGSIREYEAALRDAGGTTREVAEKNLASLKEQFGLLGSEIKETALRIGGSLAPAVGLLVRALDGLFETINGTIELIRQFQPAIATIATLGASLNTLGESADGVDRLKDALRDLVEAGREGKLGDLFRDLSAEQLTLLQQRIRASLQFLRERGEAPLDPSGQFERIMADLDRRIAAQQQVEENAADERERAAAETARKIALDDLRVAVEIGEQKKEVLLARLRDELRLTSEASEARRELLLEIHQLEEALADEQRERVEQRRDAERAARDFIVAQTGTMVDDMELELGRFASKWAEVWEELPAPVQEELGRVAELWREHIEAVRFAEPIEQELDALAEKINEVFSAEEIDTSVVQMIVADLESAKEMVEGELDAELENEQSRRRLERVLRRIEQLQRQITGKTKEDADEAERRADAEERRREDEQRAFRQIANEVERAANSALTFAANMGLVSDEMRQTLSGIIDIGAGLAQIKGGNIVGGGVQVLAGITDLIGGLTGESEADRRRAEVMKANTAALRRLTDTIGEFGLDITGDVFVKLRDALAETFARIGEGRFFTTLQDQLERVGLTMDDLAEVARQLNISFAGTIPTIEELELLLRAMAQVELTQFAETFAGQLAALRAEFELFNIEDPLEQLRRFIETVGDLDFGAPIFQFFRQLDLATEAGRQQAREWVQQLFRMMQEGTLTAATLGGLTSEQFLDALLEIERLLDTLERQAEAEAEEGEAPGVTQQFRIERTITEVTGSQIAAFLGTQTVLLEEISQHTEQMVQLLGGVPIEPPPSIQDPMIPPPAQNTWEVSVTVNVDGAGQTPEELGRTVAETTAAEIDRLLGERLDESDSLFGVAEVQQ